ncbi:hypothetical protein [Streptomyces sp. NPDC090093]|uniref:hypothetical protein n=1 Tax=Streptomyces sp. NPDC090093 TaxID=3365945 RepID=UPI0037F21854
MSDLKGRTEQADDLAVWVRKVTNGVPVRELERLFPYSKTAWTALRNGTRLASEELVNDLVDKLISKPHLRDSVRHNGHELRIAAEAAEAELKAGRPLASRLPGKRPETTAVLLRLDDARLQQLEAMRRLAASEKRCVQLEGMVSVLQDQCVQLRAERDRARREARAEVEQLQRALERSQELHQQADIQLAHARRAAGHAYELRVVAEEKVSEAKAAARHALDDDLDTAGTLLPPQALEPVLPPLDRMADVLDQTAAELVEQDQELDEFREDLGLRRFPADTTGSAVISGTVVTADPQAASGTGQTALADAAGHQSVGDGHAGAPDTSTVLVPVVPDNEADRRDNALTRIFFKDAPGSLTPLLAGVRTQHGLGRQLRRLRSRAGGNAWTTERMAQTALGDTQTGERHGRIEAWLHGWELPVPRSGFLALVTAMGADEEERAAFLAAHQRAETFSKSPVRRLSAVAIWVLSFLFALVTSTASSAVKVKYPDEPNSTVGMFVILNILLTVVAGSALWPLSKEPGLRVMQFAVVIWGTWIVCLMLTNLAGTAFGLQIADIIGIL